MMKWEGDGLKGEMRMNKVEIVLFKALKIRENMDAWANIKERVKRTSITFYFFSFSSVLLQPLKLWNRGVYGFVR